MKNGRIVANSRSPVIAVVAVVVVVAVGVVVAVTHSFDHGLLQFFLFFYSLSLSFLHNCFFIPF